MGTRKIVLDGEEIKVDVQRSGSGWVATCVFLGITFTQYAKTEDQAVSALRAKANRETS